MQGYCGRGRPRTAPRPPQRSATALAAAGGAANGRVGRQLHAGGPRSDRAVRLPGLPGRLEGVAAKDRQGVKAPAERVRKERWRQLLAAAAACG